MSDMLTMYSAVESVAVVPFGVSSFSTESDMRAYTREEARETLADIALFDELAVSRLGRSIFYASDEMYLIAGLEPPTHTHQSVDLAENGVGLISAFTDSFLHGTAMDVLGTGFFQSVDGAPAWGYRAPRLSESHDLIDATQVTILTGEYAQSRLQHLLAAIGRSDVSVVAVKNEFFGGNIKVAGLLTGADISRTMHEVGIDRQFVIPDVCLSEDRFLDGLTLKDLPAPCGVVETTGSALRHFVDSLPQKATVS
jgi:NifB/MoaA-like Fe-S oxidoreductase